MSAIYIGLQHLKMQISKVFKGFFCKAVPSLNQVELKKITYFPQKRSESFFKTCSNTDQQKFLDLSFSLVSQF